MDAGSSFVNDKGMKLSGSLAYSTIFSLPPMLLLIIIFGGTFYGQDALQGRIFTELKDIVGSNTALQIQDIIKGLQFQKNSTLATVIGTVALVIGAAFFLYRRNTAAWERAAGAEDEPAEANAA